MRIRGFDQDIVQIWNEDMPVLSKSSKISLFSRVLLDWKWSSALSTLRRSALGWSCWKVRVVA